LQGAPCSGKSLFASHYVLEYPEFKFCSIDAYRIEHENEDKAWQELLKNVAGSRNVILESCGTNWRLKELLRSPLLRNRLRVDVAFRATTNDLLVRLRERQHKRPLPYNYAPKDEFTAIDYVNEHLDWDKVDIVVETSEHTPAEQYKLLSEYLAVKRIEEYSTGQEREQNMSSISNIKIWPRKQGSGKALANCQFTYDDTFKMKCTLWQGQQGPFIGFPGNYGNKTDENGKKIFYPDISCLKEDVRSEINTAVIAEYNKETQSEGMNQGEATGPTNQESSGKQQIPF